MNWKERIKLFIRKSDVDTDLFKPKIKYQIWGNCSSDEKSIDIPNLIWIYWHDDVIDSPITKLCIARIKELNPTYQLNIVNWSNLKTFLPDFPDINPTKFPIANISDLVRLMLLNKYGGIYLDASVFLTESISWIVQICKDNRTEFGGYYTEINTTKKEYPTIETWCLVSVPQSKFVSAWLLEYSSVILSPNPDTYYKDQKELSLEESIMGYDYYKVYFAVQLIVRRSQKYKLALVEADSDAFLYSIGVTPKWNDILTSQILLINRASKECPKMIKLISTARKTVDCWVERGFYKKDSLFGIAIQENKVHTHL